MMQTDIELHKINNEMSSHHWLIRMLSEMSDYANLNGLLDVGIALDLAKESTATALYTHEQIILKSKNKALMGMMR